MCLCGMLAAEYGTLPEPMQTALRACSSRSTSAGSPRCSSGAASEGCLVLRVPPREAAACW